MVRFESVSLNYRGAGARGAVPDVFHDVSFDLAEGSFRWLLGASGSGKTTLLRMMNMSLRPTRGEGIVLGAPASSARRAVMPRLRRQIGVVFEEFRLLLPRGNYTVRFSAKGLDGISLEKTFSIAVSGSVILPPPRRYAEPRQ